MQAAGQRLIDAVKLEEEFSTLEAQDTEGALSQWQEARALVDMAERDYDAAVKRCNRVHVHCPMCPTVSLLQKTVLVLESEERESCYLRDSLEDRGSTVLVASNSAEAFDVWERCGREINLVVAEVTLTGGICGLEVAQQLSQKCPNIAALLISSYAKESLAKRGLLDPAMRLFRRMDFLQKPFSPWALEAKALVLVRR
jgi:CheY-like chemotaxis protein